MNTDLLPAESLYPWSKLQEAGWHIAHLAHVRLAGQTSINVIIIKDGMTHCEKGDPAAVFPKLEVKAKIEKRSAVPKPAKVPADPRHKEFIESWHSMYEWYFQRSYSFNGPIDGKALKTFLSANVGPVAPMIEVAKKAWAHQDFEPFCKACKLSTSIRGFCASWNEINAELTRETRSNQTNGSSFRL